MITRNDHLAALFLLSMLPASLAAQQPLQRFSVGSEFQVNTYTTFTQYHTRVVADARGSFIVVWDGRGPGGPDEVFARRYASSGLPIGTEFQVNTYTTGGQYEPNVAVDADGDFIVVWTSDQQDGDTLGVFGQRYTSAGSPAGTEFRANTFTTDFQWEASVAADSDGDFVVVWDSRGQDGDGYGIFAQRYASAGSPIGTEFQVNSYTTSDQYYNAVAVEPNGDFVVVWGSWGQDGDERGVFGQRYASSGNEIGTEFQVNSYTTGSQGAYVDQAVALDADGDFVVVWGDYRLDAGDIFGRRFASSGMAVGTDFQVNTYTTGLQGGQQGGGWWQSVAADGTGNFMVVWTTDDDGSSYGAFGQGFQSTGSQVGTEFRVNSYTTDDQRYPSVGASATGDFVVVWQSWDQDGSGFGTFGQRYVMAYERVTQAVAGGNSFGTDASESDGTQASDLVETTVETPNPGTVTITERPKSASPLFGFSVLGQLISIEAPAATSGAPLRITFELDSSLFKTGVNPGAISVYRNGALVPNCPGSVTTCTGGPVIASPDDPCISNRCIQGDLDVQITVLTSAASDWAFAMDCTVGFAKGALTIKEKSPGQEKLVAKLLHGPVLGQADFGNPLVPGGTAYLLRIYDDAQNLVGEAGVNRAGDSTCSGGATDCWKSLGAAPPDGKGYKYKDADRTADGLSQLQLKSSGSGSKILFKAKGPVPPFPTGIPDALTSTASVTMEVHADDAPAPNCWAITLPTIKAQDADLFKAK